MRRITGVVALMLAGIAASSAAIGLIFMTGAANPPGPDDGWSLTSVLCPLVVTVVLVALGLRLLRNDRST